jgi:hypothetical protein
MYVLPIDDRSSKRFDVGLRPTLNPISAEEEMRLGAETI